MALIDRVRAVLERDPDATLGRVCVCVGDSRPEMVATLMRMVRLGQRRCRVSAIPAAPTQPRHTCVSREATRTPYPDNVPI